jgi:hypothetical protein
MTKTVLCVIVLALDLLQPRTPPQAPLANAFAVVTGNGYEGAIIPATSKWHESYRMGLSTPALPAWTPDISDIAIAEQHLATFFKLALSDPAKAAALASGAEKHVIVHLPQVLKTHALRRHYYGVTLAGTKQLLVHAFTGGGDRWRSEPILMFDNGCGDLWLEVDPATGVRRFSCGGFAEFPKERSAPIADPRLAIAR